MFTLRIDDECFIVVIFEAQVSVGAVKYFAAPAAQKIAAQLQVAHQRDPGQGLDLSVLNLADPSEVFKRRS
ncbi:MAG: hypothetical protein U1F98_02230 [Verrucomicrobiota bacterium]